MHALPSAVIRAAGPLGVENDMMHHQAVARFDVGPGHPYLVSKGRRDFEVAIFQHARRWDLLHLRQLQDHVGLSERPVHKLWQGIGQRVRTFAARSAGVNPAQ